MFMKLLAGGITAVVLSAGAVSAATFPTFVFDEANSSVSVSNNLDWCLGCSLDYEFLSVADWTPTSETDSVTVSNFIEWEIGGIVGIATYNVVATIAFSAPSASSGSTGGSAGFATILGVLSAGYLSWGAPGEIVFDDGSVLDFTLESFAVGGFGNSTVSGVTFTGNTIAAVPLPAGGLLLLAGLGGLGALRRRKDKKQS